MGSPEGATALTSLTFPDPQPQGVSGLEGGQAGAAQQWMAGKLPFWRLMTGAANRMGGGSRRKEEKETETDRSTATWDKDRQTERNKHREKDSSKETGGLVASQSC